MEGERGRKTLWVKWWTNWARGGKPVETPYWRAVLSWMPVVSFGFSRYFGIVIGFVVGVGPGSLNNFQNQSRTEGEVDLDSEGENEEGTRTWAESDSKGKSVGEGRPPAIMIVPVVVVVHNIIDYYHQHFLKTRMGRRRRTWNSPILEQILDRTRLSLRSDATQMMRQVYTPVLLIILTLPNITHIAHGPVSSQRSTLKIDSVLLRRHVSVKGRSRRYGES